ncbi:sulfatase [Tautonia sociabilis]|nr:sulfatase [Tautonia sociabilis]
MTSTATEATRTTSREAAPARDDPSSGPGGAWPGPGPAGLIGLAAWLGLLAGYLEVLALVLTDHEAGALWDSDNKSRHYPWMIPLADAAMFVTLALPASAIMIAWRKLGARIGLFVLGTAAPLPPLMVLLSNVGIRLHPIALALLTAGLACRLLPGLRRRGRRIGRAARLSTPAMLMGLVALAGFTATRGLRSAPRPVAEAAGRPNVLLIVLDTVRADHLDLYGYRRPTSPRLSALAGRGVRFERAFATSPWTLPSHASLMTGRWPAEVAGGRYEPMDATAPTLAEVCSRLGYETAGFVANLFYCTYATGLDRGFSHYEDFPATPMRALVSSALGTFLVDQADALIRNLDQDPARPSSRIHSKDADTINRDFLRWLDGRRGDRPFFAFLNYFDAHDPYLVPKGAEHRFGRRPEANDERQLLQHWWFWPNKDGITPEDQDVLVDGYDSCLAYLDERIGRLLDELEGRGLLEETIVVVTSDHGEAFGEHGLYGHGGSLYHDQIDVPLIVAGPGVPEGTRVAEAVSLRDVPATILDLIGAPEQELPGSSLAPLWEGQTDAPRSPRLATVAGANPFPPNGVRSPVRLGRMAAIIDAQGFKYIRIQMEGRGRLEELYQLQIDPGEEQNLARFPQLAPALDASRRALDEVLGGISGGDPGAPGG